MGIYTRRNFVKSALLGGAAITLINPANILYASKASEGKETFVSVSSGEDRADMVFRALQPFSRQIKKAIGNRRVVLKPNNVLMLKQQATSNLHLAPGNLPFIFRGSVL